MTNPCKHHPHFVWMDLEMTGLDANKQVILEIACLITDKNLSVLAEHEPIVIHHDERALAAMEPWSREHHTQSGLLAAVYESKINTAQAEQKILAFIKQYCKPQLSPLCGNSVWMDRLFLRRHMPQLEGYLHYRVLDVSSFKLAINCWYGNGEQEFFKKQKHHRSLDDIKESIAELAFYRQKFFVPRD